jgi:hypothetical protein
VKCGEVDAEGTGLGLGQFVDADVVVSEVGFVRGVDFVVEGQFVPGPAVLCAPVVFESEVVQSELINYCAYYQVCCSLGNHYLYCVLFISNDEVIELIC